MKPKRTMFWPTTKEQIDFMRKAERKNRGMSKKNPHENSAAHILREHSTLKWSRQARFGGRIFDFWCHERGLALEIDGKTHDPLADAKKDEELYLRYGIIVLRAQNGDLNAIRRICRVGWSLETWRERRIKLGLLFESPTVDEEYRLRLERED